MDFFRKLFILGSLPSKNFLCISMDMLQIGALVWLFLGFNLEYASHYLLSKIP